MLLFLSVDMFPLPVAEPEVKSGGIESMSSSALNDEPPKKRRRSSGVSAAKGRKPSALMIGFIQKLSFCSAWC